MRIDAHQHFWRFEPVRDAWITDEMRVIRRDFLPDDLRPELSRHRLDGCVAVQAVSSEQETIFLLDLAARWKEIYSVVGWVDLRAPDIYERLAYFARFEKLAGFRHIVQSEPDSQFLLRENFLRGIGALAEFGYTYDILIYPTQLPAAVEFVDRFPDQPFVIDHIAKPVVRTGEIEPWSAYIRILASYPNVFCKVSGLLTEADWHRWTPEQFRPYLDVVFESFGPRRLLFGSDWPVCLVAGTYSQVVDLVAGFSSNLPSEDQEAIFGMNAARFYRARNVTSGSRTRR